MAKKKQKYHSFYENEIRYMECSICGTFEEGIDKLTKSIICSECLMRKALNLWDPMKNTRTETKKTKGWHWMKEFVDKDGTVYHLGKEQPKLKGTLKPTVVKPIKKKRKKRRTKQQMLLAIDAERKAELKKAVQKQKDFLNHNIDKG